MKTCYKCKVEKSLSEFAKNKSRKDGYNGMCKQCKNEYTKTHYNDNKQYYLDKAARNKRAYQEKARVIILSHLSNHPCTDCGESNPVVLEFDHMDGVNKIDGVGAMIQRGMPLDMVQAEMLKCEVRCCNCHRIRTAKQFGWWLDRI